MQKVCLCVCHDTDEWINYDGVDVANVIDAAIACTGCINNHCAALLDPANAALLKPRIDERTAEQRAAAWDLHQRQQQRGYPS